MISVWGIDHGGFSKGLKPAHIEALGRYLESNVTANGSAHPNEVTAAKVAYARNRRWLALDGKRGPHADPATNAATRGTKKGMKQSLTRYHKVSAIRRNPRNLP